MDCFDGHEIRKAIVYGKLCGKFLYGVCVKVEVKTEVKMTTTTPVNGLNSPSSVEDDSEVIFVIVIAVIILL